ncbi:MAG: Holliday junction resolvase-like protein [Anaerolineaceae bacterium]|nr:Holliday junction resolvase-like protein [Anaerolineaceae bacterium]
MDTAVIVIAVIVGVLLGALMVVWYSNGRSEKLIRDYEQKIQALNQRYALDIERARKESVDQSRNTLKGKMAEQMAPLLPGFNFLPADSRFLGDPVDYVVFDGYSHMRDGGGSGEELELVIVDIKQGQAVLSSSQRAIAKAVEDGRVRFDVVRILDDGTVSSHTWQSSGRGKKAKAELAA